MAGPVVRFPASAGIYAPITVGTTIFASVDLRDIIYVAAAKAAARDGHGPTRDELRETLITVKNRPQLVAFRGRPC